MKASIPLVSKAALASGVFASRFFSLPANFSPLGSFGFFSNNILLFMGQIVLFDFIRGGFYTGFYWTYLGFFSYFLLGRFAARKTKRQLISLPLASFLFFLVSNFGVWMHWYPTQTLESLLSCYVLALPFYTNTLLSDLVFGYSFMLLRALHQRYSFSMLTDQFRRLSS